MCRLLRGLLCRHMRSVIVLRLLLCMCRTGQPEQHGAQGQPEATGEDGALRAAHESGRGGQAGGHGEG
jgi:hypothetical protein